MNAKVNMSQQSSLMGKSLLGSSMSIKILFFYCEDGETLEQAAWGGCGVSSLGNTKNLMGHSSGQCALCESASSKEAGLGDPRLVPSNHNYSVML